MGEHISPFLHLDYAGSEQFAPTLTPRGVGSHPHRGFETVTIVYQGEVEHRDSTGSGSLIGPGDVQWMAAAVRIISGNYSGHARPTRTFTPIELWYHHGIRAAGPQWPAHPAAGSCRLLRVRSLHHTNLAWC